MANNTRPAQPVTGSPTLRYFLDRSGVATKRMANVSGKGHFDIAQEYLGPDAADLYGQMETLGFARVQETTSELHVEARSLTNHQKRYLKQRASDLGLELILNSQQFVESKDPRALKMVSALLS